MSPAFARRSFRDQSQAGPGPGSHRAGRRPPRRGFSLLELTVAIVVLEVGVLALVATAAGVVRLTARGYRSGASALVAAARLDGIRAGLCAQAAEDVDAGVSGASAAGRFRERWTVSGGAGFASVRLDVTYPNGTGDRTDTYETAIRCER